MFVNPIYNLDRTRFGINFKIEDIKCKLDNKNKKECIIKNIDEYKRVDNKTI